MKSPATLLAVTLLALGNLPAGDGSHSAPAPADSWKHSPVAEGAAQKLPYATVSPGDPAPDFSFEAHDHQWRQLHDLLAHGDVLLVFGADDPRLVAIEAERDTLLANGIVPVAVLDRHDGAVWATPQRLGLHYGVVPDARGVIAEQFNSLNPVTGRAYPSWFVVDRKGMVRGLYRGALPEQGFTAVAERALGLPPEDAARPVDVR